MPVIQLPRLGKQGRFGNQLFQYSFARGFARRNGYDLQIPESWQGRRCFPGIYGDVIKKDYPLLGPEEVPKDGQDASVQGFFQGKEHLRNWTKAEAREWFVFDPGVLKEFGKVREVCAHVARGPHVWRGAPVIGITSYINCIKKLGKDLGTVYWIGEEYPCDSAPTWHPFLSCFIAMMKAKVLLRGASTFSWWAGLLGEAEVWCPWVEEEKGWAEVEFVKGNAGRIMAGRDLLEVEDR